MHGIGCGKLGDAVRQNLCRPYWAVPPSYLLSVALLNGLPTSILCFILACMVAAVLLCLLLC